MNFLVEVWEEIIKELPWWVWFAIAALVIVFV